MRAISFLDSNQPKFFLGSLLPLIILDLRLNDAANATNDHAGCKIVQIQSEVVDNKI